MIRFYLPIDDDEETHELLVPRQDRYGPEALSAEREPGLGGDPGRSGQRA